MYNELGHLAWPNFDSPLFDTIIEIYIILLIFQFQIVTETRLIKRKQAPIEERKQVILALEKSIGELHDMFEDMAMLVESQVRQVQAVHKWQQYVIMLSGQRLFTCYSKHTMRFLLIKYYIIHQGCYRRRYWRIEN